MWVGHILKTSVLNFRYRDWVEASCWMAVHCHPALDRASPASVFRSAGSSNSRTKMLTLRKKKKKNDFHRRLKVCVQWTRPLKRSHSLRNYGAIQFSSHHNVDYMYKTNMRLQKTELFHTIRKRNKPVCLLQQLWGTDIFSSNVKHWRSDHVKWTSHLAGETCRGTNTSGLYSSHRCQI